MDNVHVHVRVGSDHLEEAVDDNRHIAERRQKLESARTASPSSMTGAMPVRWPRANEHIARRAIRNTVKRKGGPGTRHLMLGLRRGRQHGCGQAAIRVLNS